MKLQVHSIHFNADSKLLTFIQKKLNKLDIVSMKPDDIYFKALSKKDNTNDVQDVLIESY